MTPSTAIVIYSISYSDGVLRELPYVEYFYERCLSQLGRLTDSETRVVVVTPAPVDPVILNYHFSDILGLSGAARRSAVRRTLFLSPDSSDVGSLAERVLDDDRLLSRLLDERSADDVTLVNFAASDAIAQLGTLLGIEVEEGPPELATRWGSKSGSKTAFERGGVPAAAGTADVLRSTAEVTSAALDLARRHEVSRVVVKLDDAEWASGIGNAVVDIEQLRATQRLESAIVQILQPWDDFAAEVGRGGAIVEEYLRDVACTPSGQGYIEPDGNVRVVSTHDQHVVHDEYVGCVYPATSRWGTGIEVALRNVGSVLAADGVRGTFGLDFICSTARGLLATEINLRKLGPTHVLDYVRASMPTAPSNGPTDDDAPRLSCHYVHRRVYRPDVLTGTSPRALIRRLDSEGLLFDRQRQTGVLLHTLGALRPCGYVETTCVGKSRRDANAVDALAQSLLSEAQLVVG